MPTKLSFPWGLALAGLLFVFVEGSHAAGDEVPAETVAGAGQPAAAETTPDPDKADESADEAAPADAVVGQMGEVSLEEFVPSEEIGADGAVSFPVDI